MKRWLALGASVLLFWGAATACSGGGGTGGGGQTTPAGITPAPGSAPKPQDQDSTVVNGVTITSTPVAASPPVSDAPTAAVKNDIPNPAAPAAPEAPPPPSAPMVASITSPLAGSLWPLTAVPEPAVPLSGESNKKDATYKWDVLDPQSVAVDVATDKTTGSPYFVPKSAGTFTITLSGAAADGTSNSTSVQVQVLAPPDPGTVLQITGMVDGSNYPLGKYPLSAMSYVDYANYNYFKYSWGLTQKPEGSLATVTGTSHTAAFEPDKEGSYTIQVTATNLTGQTAQKGITVTLMPVKVIPYWQGYPGSSPNVVHVVDSKEMVVATGAAIFKFGPTQWLPLWVVPSKFSGVYSLAKTGASLLYAGSYGKLIRLDGAIATEIPLPGAEGKAGVTAIGGKDDDVWAITQYGDVFHVVNKTPTLEKIPHGDVLIEFAPDDILVVGKVANSIYHYGGAEKGWTATPSAYPNTSDYMAYCATALPAKSVLCVSTGGKLYATIPDEKGKFTALTPVTDYDPLPATAFIGIALDNAYNPSLMDDKGNLFNYSAEAKKWGVPISAPAGELTYLKASLQAGQPAVLAAKEGVYLHDGKAWVSQDMPLGFSPSRFLKVPNGPILAVGDDLVVHIDPLTKHIIKTEKVPATLYDVAGNSIDSIWAISSTKTFFHYDGTAWTEVVPILPEVPQTQSYDGEFGMSADGKTLYSTTYGWPNSFVQSTDGKNFEAMASDKLSMGVERILPADAQTVYAFGGDLFAKTPAIWKLGNAGKWEMQALPVIATSLIDAVVISPTDITAVGLNGGILHYDGSKWVSETSGVTGTLVRVSAANGTVMAMTEGGQLIMRDAKLGTWTLAGNLQKDQASNLGSFFMVSEQEFFYGGPGLFNFVGVMGN